MIAAVIAVLIVGAIYVGARSAESIGGRRSRRAGPGTDKAGGDTGPGSWADGGSGDAGCGDGGGGCD